MELEDEIQNTERLYEQLEKNIDSEPSASKDDFSNIVSSCLKDGKSFLETKAYLEKTLKCKLGPEDCNFVEDEYVELLLEFWLEDTFTKIIHSFNSKQPDEFVTLLNHLCSFHDCYDNFETLIYNDLIVDLLESETNISANLKAQEKKIFSKLKHRCVSHVLVFINNSHGEIGFIKNFIHSLKHTKDLEQLNQTLQLRSFLENQITFQELLSKFNQIYFSSDKHFIQLKRSASQIIHQDHHYTEEIKKVVAAYFKPITINESHIDGRYLLEVTGKHLVFSKVLSVLEQSPNFPEIEEVRFVNFGAVHVDKNLTGPLWHGKNLVVLADAVIVSEDKIVTWNVSGNDGKPLENYNSLGADPKGVGLNGAKGNPGESGGNVCILYSTLENGHNLEIISNGGNGSQGQNGGNGIDGDHGSNFDGDVFKKEFPPVSKFQDHKKVENIKKTMQRIASDLESVQTFSYEYSDLPVTKEEFKTFFSDHSLGTTFFEVTTKEGMKITFSFYYGSMFTVCQSYLLVKGSPGKIGEPGGSGGIGGKGGFAGQIQFAQNVGNSPDKCAENGENGATGTSGLCGVPGKDGLDRGYMDYSATLLSHSKWPKWFIPVPQDNSRLSIISHTKSDSNYVWCAKKQSYVEIATAPSLDHVVGHSRPQTYHTERQETTYEDQVPRKKTINPEDIVDLYKETHSVFETFNVVNGLQELKGELEALLEKSTQETEQVTKGIKVIRQLSVCLNEWYSNKVIINQISVNPHKETKSQLKDISLSHLIDLVKKDPKNLIMWTRLQNLGLNLQDLSILWDIATSNRSVMKSEESRIDLNGEIVTALTMLCDKYKLATLKSIANDLESCEFPDFSMKIGKIYQLEFLGTEDISLNTTRTKLCSNVDFVESYICNDTDDLREEVVKIINLTRLEEKSMKSSVNCFLFEVDCQESDTLSTLKKLSLEKNIRKEKKLSSDFMVFKSEVFKPQNQEIQKLFKGAAEQNMSATVEFEQKVSKNQLLKAMYIRLMKELKSERGLDGFTEQSENEFRLIFTNFILSKGPFSETYREFLSHHYDVNIRIYSNQESGNMVFISNHNPTASISVHFLKKKDGFVRLNLNVDLVNLMKNISKQGEFCEKVMFHVDSLEEKTEFENFMTSKPYRSKSYKGANKKEEIRLRVHHVVNQEKNCKQIASSFECRNDQLIIYSRIEKLKIDFIENENLLHYMALHFTTEPIQVTCAELCFIINMILRFWTEQPRVTPMVSWVIAAHSQEHWLTELALIELELYLNQELKKDVKTKWRQYLGDENNRDSLMVLVKKITTDKSALTQENFEEVFYLMSKVPSALDGLENYAITEWKYFLKDRYYAFQMKSISSWDDEELKELAFYLLNLENVNGIDNCKKILSSLKTRCEEMKKESNRVCVMEFFKQLSSNEICLTDALLNKLSEQKVKYWKGIIDEVFLNHNTERKIDQLVNLIHQSGNTSDKILEILPDITKVVEFNTAATGLFESYDEAELKNCIGSFKSKTFVNKLKSMGKKLSDLVLGFNHDSILRLLEYCGIPIPNCQSKSTDVGTFTADEKLNRCFLVPLIFMVIKNKHGINLRDTQKLALTIFLKHSGNTLAQISTGEGKSLIVVAVAIYKALNQQKVNIITSSKVLAERDAQLYRDIFECCGLTVGHNCSENIEERKKVYSNCQVIYGDLANFQRDYLLDRFYNKNILGDHTFETVIVDEVDSMLLDKGANILYLSHPIPGLDNLEPLFVHVWKFISSSIETKHFTEIFNPKTLKGHFMFQIFGQIKKEDIGELDSNISRKCLVDTWDYLISKKIIDEKGIVVKLKVEEDLILEDVPSGCVSKDHLRYFLKKVIERENPIKIPACHRQFVEEHLENWIKSAMIAMKMENGRDYVVDVDRSQASSDRLPNITIVDRDTGTDLVSSQWDEGLHQFLQLKHGCKLSLISLKNVFISNVSFLKLYKQLHGLTGTLGSKRERELLKEIYDVDFVTIPTAKAKQFTEIPPVICFNKADWIEKIKQEINQITEKRSALIICESVNEVLTLKDSFPNRHVHIYKRDYEALPAAKNLNPGHIIISTNLAGRGTDIKLSNELVRAGGLHVCLSFLPSNSRVEEQAYGRAARNGEPGTAQMIFKYIRTNQLSSVSQSKILDFKRERDMNELIRLMNIRTNYESKIKAEEELFGRFKHKYKLLSNKKVRYETVKDILLQICLEKWTFWLDKYSKDIDHSQNTQEVNKSFSDLMSSCENIFEENDGWIENISDPVHLTKLGLAFLNVGDHAKAENLFDSVIKLEPDFSESAYYYRVCAKTKAKDLNSFTSILNDLTQVLIQLQKKVNQHTCTMNIIDWIKEHDSNNVLQIDSFKRQQTEKCKIYSLFIQSVHRVVGDEITPETLSHPFLLDRFSAEVMYHKLIEKKVLSDVHLDPQLSQKNLGFVVKYGLSPLKVKSFLEKYNFEVKFDSQVFLKKLKNEFKVPSRELFWKELISNGLMKEEEKYVFFDMHLVASIDPSLKNHLELGNEVAPHMNNGKVWLYEQKEFFQSNPNMVLSIVNKEKFKSKIGLERYKYLKQRNVFFVNKSATFEMVENFTFNHFDSLEFADFDFLNISENIVLSIVRDLVDQKIIQENTDKSKVYSLACDPSLLEKVELLSNRAYTLDVRSLLELCFAYRLSLSKALLLQTCLGERFSLKFLPTVVHKNMFFEMIDNKVLKLPVVKGTVAVKPVLEKLYPKMMAKTYCRNMFTEQFGGEKARKIVDCLIESNWLVVANKKVDCLIKSNWLVVANQKVDSKSKNYFVNINVNPENTTEQGENSSPKLNTLAAPFDLDKETISSILIHHLNCIEKLSKIANLVESLKGDHCTVETPDFGLKPLVEALREQHLPVNEIEVFSIKGFDQLIVLEEKRWTWKTKLAIFILIGTAIVQVVIGAVFLLTSNPLGSAFMCEGANDVIYAINCMFTGSFSWKNYALQKLISLSLTAFTMFTFNPKCVSDIGGKVKSVSFKSIKEWISESLGLPMKRESVEFIVTKSSVTIVSAVARGALYAAADNIIEPQLENLSESIIEILYSDIDEIIDNHPCSSIEDVFRMFPPSEAHTILSDTCSEMLDALLTTNEKDWFELASTIFKSVKFARDLLKYERLSSAPIDLIYDASNLIQDVSKIIELANSVFKKSRLHWTTLNNIISNLLQKIDNHLADVVDQAKCKNVQVQNECFDCIKAVAETKSTWKNMTQKRLSNKLKQSVLSPLVQYTADKLANTSHRFIAQKTRRSLASQKTREINKLKEKHLMKQSKKDCTLDCFHETEFDERLIKMLSKQRSAKLFVEVMKKNIPVDTSFIRMCCTIVPAVLKREGISCPSLEIIVESSDQQERFYTNEEKPPISTIFIAPDTDLKSNLILNKVLIRDLVDQIISGFIQADPQNKNLTVEILSNVLMEAIENYPFVLEPTESTCNGSQTTQSSNTLNMSVEGNVPTQHSLPDGDWIFRPQVDFDLRINESIVSAVQTQDHISKGFYVALKKINNHIHTCHKAFRYFKLKMEDFEEKEFDVILQTDRGKTGNFCCVTTKYELTIPISIIVNNDMILVEFKIIMQLKHRNDKTLAKTPVGPHIFYEISLRDNLTFGYFKGIRGHILLNRECEEIVYTAEKCLIAGDLILFSGLSLQKSCKTLFLGETLLANSTEDTSMRNCIIKSFKSMRELKTAISEIPTYYKDISNVIIYVGMSESLTMKPPIGVVKDVDSVLQDIEHHIKKATITVCSLFEVEGKSAKIRQVNKTLRLHCGSKCYSFLDTNKVIFATDLETDKKHIKPTVVKTIVEKALTSTA